MVGSADDQDASVVVMSRSKGDAFDETDLHAVQASSAGSFDPLFRNCSPNTKELVKKALVIASELNHGELLISHLLLAMTLVPRGAECLVAKKLEERAIRQACWDQLSKVDPLPVKAHSVVFSDDVMDVFREAQNISRKELDETAQSIHLPQIMRAIVDPPLAPKFDSLVSGKPFVDVDFETYKMVADTRSRLGLEYVPKLQATLDLVLGEVARLGKAQDERSTALTKSIDGIEKRARHVKHIATAIVGLAGLALISLLFALIR